MDGWMHEGHTGQSCKELNGSGMQFSYRLFLNLFTFDGLKMLFNNNTMHKSILCIFFYSVYYSIFFIHLCCLFLCFPNFTLCSSCFNKNHVILVFEHVII